jgi:hypothetical protein
MNRAAKFDLLDDALKLATQLSQQLGLDHLPMILDMARLELLNELANAGRKKAARQRHLN